VAVILATRAALRSGVGLITCVIPESIIDRIGTQVIEATYLSCPEMNGFIELSQTDLENIVNRCDVLAIGIGLGKTEQLKDNLRYLFMNNIKPMVLDADGINLLAEIREAFKQHKGDIILTPHTGEMARLIGRDIEFIENNRIEVAKQFALEYKCIMLLKGNHTIVTDGNRIYINKTGNPGMATGGSGDVLTGIIGSLLAQGYEPFDAAALGACIHGMAGDMAYDKFGNGLIAGDLIDFLGICLKG
jgi:ADP-dependent NAD(P)H-hydrate dehydratase / NAD(P)H-hydrate epimerase